MNIPQRAFFYWDAGEAAMPWPRRLAVESFKKHNPGWSVQVLERNPTSMIPTGARRAAVLRSDYARYSALALNGGWYFDTDIIFDRPIPPEWSACDFTVSVNDEGACTSIAAIGAAPGARILRVLMGMAETLLLDEHAVLSYQSLGVKLFWQLGHLPHAVTQMGLRWRNLPLEALLPIGWPYVEQIWSPRRPAVPAETVGLHWFGGDEISREFVEQLGGPEDLDRLPCLFSDFARRAAGVPLARPSD